MAKAVRVRRRRHAEARRPVPWPRRRAADAGTLRGRRCTSTAAVDAARRAADRAQPLGDAPDAHGAARGAGRRTCSRRARWSRRTPALRLLAHPAADAGESSRRSSAWSTPKIRANHATEVHHMDMQEALDFGAMALFGEKYGDACACCASATRRPSCAAARTSRAPATSACSRSSPKAASPPACAASRR